MLNNEQDLALRLSAAKGLSGWNVRRGVATLVELLESEGVLPNPTRMPYVRDNASEFFRNANARKGWGFPEDETRKSIMSRTDLNDDEKAAHYIAEIKKWFATNEHRFPEWKLGDPLPKVEESKTDPSERR